MREHGRPRGRFPSPSRTVPPHVLAERQAWDDYKAKTTPEQRARQAALLHGVDPDANAVTVRRQLAAQERQGSLFEQPRFREVFGGFTCCYCDGSLTEDGYEWAHGSRLRCRRPECHAADERERRRAG